MERNLSTTCRVVSLGAFLAFIFLTIVSLFSVASIMRTSNSSDEVLWALESVRASKPCDLSTGDWIPNPSVPYYTSCHVVSDYHDCIKNGKPSLDFIKWRWKPDDCDLPVFDPTMFLELVRGKSLAFVGDSLERNHMLSLICILSKVELPIEFTNSQHSKRWKYKNYNFSIANFWSPYLVRAREPVPDQTGNSKLLILDLDEADMTWSTKMEEFDYVIISSGHWWYRPSAFYIEAQPVGISERNGSTMLDGYKRSLGTAFRAIYSLKNYKGITYLRTFSPSHFENGRWNEKGNCLRKRPFMRSERYITGTDLEIYMAQLDEFKVAEEQGQKRGLKFRLLDITQAMLRRPDGHPAQYGLLPLMDLPNDCLHWCLPGPIDTWNDLLLEMIKREDVVF